MSEGNFVLMEVEGLEPDMEIQEAMRANPTKDIVGLYAKAIELSFAKRIPELCKSLDLI